MYVYLLILATTFSSDLDKIEISQPIAIYRNEKGCKDSVYRILNKVELESYMEYRCIKVKVIE